MKEGLVYLIGAGPGDPSLITVAGLERLREADVVVYDRLVSSRLLEEARTDAEFIFVGKGDGKAGITQGSINELLVDRGRRGQLVARLKGGDPFVFGRGGEEAEVLQANGVPFEVVPGISAAVAVPAYAGIPVTHRGLSSSIAIITGHEDPEKEQPSLHWEKLATAVDTLVLLMGASTLPRIIQELIANGRSPKTPAAAIRWGTTPRQRTVHGTISDIVLRVEKAGLEAPIVTIIGDVVRLQETLSWYERRPLFGKRILVTRSRRQASALSRLLAREGAEPVELPTIDIQPLANSLELAEAARRLASGYHYGWVIFTSVNGVHIFFDALHSIGLDTRAFAGTKICVIGPATAEALAEQGLTADLMPSRFIAEGILTALKSQDLAGTRILLPRASSARVELVHGLRGLGAEVDELTIYSSRPPSEMSSDALATLHNGEIDIVTFTSSSTVRNLAHLLDNDFGCLSGTTIACIGPVTAATAKEILGYPSHIVAQKHTVPGLVEALKEQISSDGNGV